MFPQPLNMRGGQQFKYNLWFFAIGLPIDDNAIRRNV